jgi:hypothetical protein
MVSLASLGPLFLVVRVLTAQKAEPLIGTRLVLAVFALKLPAIAICIYLAALLRPTGLVCFLAELGLVYFSVVWILTERTIREQSFKGHS